MRLLPILAAAPLCVAFAPQHPPSMSRAIQHRCSELRASGSKDIMEDMSKAAGSALVALTLCFSSITAPPADASTNVLSMGPSISIARGSKELTDDDIALQMLEKETKKDEKEAKKDAKKAALEKKREAFFEYDAKAAEQTEARIEAAERKAELEYEKDKELAEEFKREEQQAEKDLALAKTKEEKAAKQKQAKELLKKERELERKEKRAEKMEKLYLAEEATEKQIVAKKEQLAIEEEKKFEEVEKEYESVAELAKEDEAELSLFKQLTNKKK